MRSLEIIVLSKKEKIPHLHYAQNHCIYHPDQAKELCRVTQEKWNVIFPAAVASAFKKRNTNKDVGAVFEKVIKLIDELVGPVESWAFNCDRYHEYLVYLLDIAKLMGTNCSKQIKEIETYLQAYNEHQEDEEMSPLIGRRSQMSKIKEWDKTFVDLKHSPDSKNFGLEWKQIVEPIYGDSLIFPKKSYDFPCHGQ